MATTLSEALAGYMHRWRVKTNPAPGTAQRMRYVADSLDRQLGGVPLGELRFAHVEDVLMARAVERSASAKAEGQLLRRVLADAERRGERFDPMLFRLDSIAYRGRTGIALDLDELQRLGSWFPDRLRYFPEIVGSIGLRLMEALGLTDDRIDLERGTLYIPKPKEKRPKLIQLAGFERELIAGQLEARGSGPYVFPHREGKPWEKPTFYPSVWYPARKAAGEELRKESPQGARQAERFDLLVPHDLRHTAISLMAAGGMKPEVIAKRVGHSDGGRLILARYRHLFPDEMEAQLATYETWRRERLAA